MKDLNFDWLLPAVGRGDGVFYNLYLSPLGGQTDA